MNKLEEAYNNEEFDIYECINNCAPLEVEFDLENWGGVKHHDHDYLGFENLLGLNLTNHGKQFIGMNAGGDWEHPVFFLLYIEGEEIKCYIPKEGNTYNKICMTAFGSEGDSSNFDSLSEKEQELAETCMYERVDPDWQMTDPDLNLLWKDINTYFHGEEPKDEITKTLQKYKEHAEKEGLIVYAIGLKGSQNYNLADAESDIDANLVFIPTLQQLRTNKKYKFTFDGGEVTCHNIYSFAEIVAKGNPQWIEVCHSEWQIGSFDLFKHYNLNPSALKGMMMEKVHAFSKLYPSREKYIKEFGYDVKQLYHIIRLYDTLNLGVNVHKYNEVDRTWMMDIKRGRLPGSLEKAEELRDIYITKLAEIYETKKIKYTPQEVNYPAIDTIVMKYLSNAR